LALVALDSGDGRRQFFQDSAHVSQLIFSGWLLGFRRRHGDHRKGKGENVMAQAAVMEGGSGYQVMWQGLGMAQEVNPKPLKPGSSSCLIFIHHLAGLK
jgi:hypothetical protein